MMKSLKEHAPKTRHQHDLTLKSEGVQNWLKGSQLAAETAELATGTRPLLRAAQRVHELEEERGLAPEQAAERAADRGFWAPLRSELDRLLHA